jgi:lipopolysaccharide/colanic/teichoic acid biosynthesis glycosyltransferase
MVITSGTPGFTDRALKRSFDLAFSVLALLFLAPLLCAVALAIKLESPGPIFFHQPRIGRRNTLFRLIKFRTMRSAVCDVSGIASTCRGDPRLTRLGSFLRRTSIDELPQFVNVLRGEMSVVGPRPHAINSTAEDRLFWDADDRYWLRHACRPGLTGLAQIRGFRGATTCISDLTDRVEADLQYLQSWSLWQDIIIIIKTVRVLSNDKAF